MPRPKTHTRKSIASAAMEAFWNNGYEATSLHNLVRHTGASRQSIYAEFGGKRDLFLAALNCYQTEVVTPAFAQVERSEADLSTVRAYFLHQIERAETSGLPGPGCLIANTMTEVAPHDLEIGECVKSHNDRLHAGFINALGNEYRKQKSRVRQTQLAATASTTVVFAQGLWSFSRAVNDAAPLKTAVDRYLHFIGQGATS